MAEIEGFESSDSEINVGFLHPRFQTIPNDPDVALDDVTEGRGITSEDSSKSSITPRSSARLPLGDEYKPGRSKLWSFSSNGSDSLELHIPAYHERYQELHRARSTRNLELLVDPQMAPPPRLRVIDPAYERGNLRKQLQGHPGAIASMPCLPRFASGEGLEYVYGESDETGTPKLAGEGQYGCVYLARHERTGQLLTIKLLSSETATIYDLALEASINQHLEVTTVVPNFWGVGVVERDSRYLRYCLMQEYVGNVRTLEGYDINRFLTVNKLSRYYHGCVPPFDSVDWTAVCCRIVAAMNTIHRMGVVINDIKGDNILVRFESETSHLYFVDFGMARYRTNLLVDFGLATYEERDDFLERFFIMAPEIVYTRQCYEASDVFSLGWLLVDISARCNLPQLKGVAEWCLKPLPSQRPTAQQLLQSTKDIFYDAIRRKMALCTHQYLLSQLWRLYALSPDNFYLLVSR